MKVVMIPVAVLTTRTLSVSPPISDDMTVGERGKGSMRKDISGIKVV